MGFGTAVPNLVLAPTTVLVPVAPLAKFTGNVKTAVQSAPPMHPALPSADEKTYTASAVESTTGPCTITMPPSALETSSGPAEVATKALLGPTRHSHRPTSTTNTPRDTRSKTAPVLRAAV